MSRRFNATLNWFIIPFIKENEIIETNIRRVGVYERIIRIAHNRDRAHASQKKIHFNNTRRKFASIIFLPPHKSALSIEFLGKILIKLKAMKLIEIACYWLLWMRVCLYLACAYNCGLHHFVSHTLRFSIDFKPSHCTYHSLPATYCSAPINLIFCFNGTQNILARRWLERTKSALYIVVIVWQILNKI